MSAHRRRRGFPAVHLPSDARELAPPDYIQGCAPNAPGDQSRIFDLLGAKHNNGLDNLAEQWQRDFRPVIDTLSALTVAKLQGAVDDYFSEMGWNRDRAREIGRGQSSFCFRPPSWYIAPHTHALAQLLQR